ncbi:unnamed protein product [Knipowitschia caucasica]
MAEKLHSSSSGYEVAVLEDIQMTLMECKVCFNDYSEDCRAQHLLCGHVLCQECVSALSHPVHRKLECPFCRQLCSLDHTCTCQVLSDLQEMLLLHESRGAAVPSPHSEQNRLKTDGPAVLGGWGTLNNPVGLDNLGSLGTIVVAHDGDHRVVVLSSKGDVLNSFGPRGKSCGEISYPLDVAVCPLGHVVVTDGGDKAVKVYTSRGMHIMTIRALFQLPWGVDTDIHGSMIVSDALAGSLFQINVDYGCRRFECHTVVTNLVNPKAVSCCSVTGNIATVEHLKQTQHTRLNVYTNNFHMFYQNDSSNMSLQFNVVMQLSAVAFGPNGDLFAVDSCRGMVWSLGKPWCGSVPAPLVSANLIRPVALAYVNTKLVILDSGDHTVKTYNTKYGSTT